MHGANNAARLTISANGTWARNSEAAESFRRALQNGLGYGAISRVAHRLVGIVPEHSVTDQVEGAHRLSVAVALEALREVPNPAAILTQLLAPLGLSVYATAPDRVTSAPLEALAGATADLGRVAAELWKALADGRVDARERSAILGEVATLESACMGIRASVSGGDL